MTAGEHELRLDNVTRRFGDKAAVDKVSLTISAGELVALLGPSGCGKSTTLGCVAGLTELTEGEVWFDGRRVDTLPTERRGFGMVFQNYALFPHLSVRRNVSFGLEVRGEAKSGISDRVREVLAAVQLADYGDRYPAQLSGGQQQRVALARALAPRPQLMLMDEPLSNLDAKLRLEMRTEIRRIHDELGLTTMYVTHDQEEAMAVADRVVILREGKIVQDGTPETVYSRPATAYVADFMGYRNLLPFTVGKEFDASSGQLWVSGHGVELVGTAPGELPGSTATVAFRPDEAVIAADGAANSFPMRVLAARYQGREFAVEGELDDGQRVHVRTPQRIAAGDQVRVAVPAERLLIYPDEHDTVGSIGQQEAIGV